MASLLLKNIPESLHKKLKEQARKHRRSMIQEAIILLEESLSLTPQTFPNPVKGKKVITQDIITTAIQDGRS